MDVEDFGGLGVLIPEGPAEEDIDSGAVWIVEGEELCPCVFELLFFGLDEEFREDWDTGVGLLKLGH